ncbi:J domain-containing protein [Pirellulaceae bacterium]|nr:J domain-containing protein [Pirellulaceae bacterium]
MAEDYYDTLGIARSASDDEIQKAYRALARKYHPDMNDNSEKAKEKFQQVQQAYDVLNDKDKRQMYDQLGPDFQRYQQGGGSPNQSPYGFDLNDIFGGAGGGRGSAGQSGGGFGGGFEDILRQFGGQAGGRAAPPSKGRDLQAEITIAFQTSIVGGSANVTLSREGKRESVEVKIPAGMESGKKLRLKGQGGRSPNGGPRGDAFVKVVVAPHPCYSRKRNNLEVRVPISIAEAILGGKIDVPTLNGEISVTVPAGSSSGRKLRLKGLGVPIAANPGDLLVELQITIPNQIDEALKQLALGYHSDENLRSEIRW